MFFRNVKVAKVVDGDTIDVLIDLGFHLATKQRLRLSGLDTEELRSPDEHKRNLAKMAKQFLEDSLLGKNNICVYTIKTEKYGRYLAEVYFEESDGSLTSVNDLLLDNGLAKAYL